MRVNVLLAAAVFSLVAANPAINQKKPNTLLARHVDPHPKEEISGPGQPGSNVYLDSLNGNNSSEMAESRHLKLRILGFGSHLKSFIFRGTFNFVGFSFEVDDLRKRLVELEAATSRASPSEEMLSMLRNAKHAFHVIEDSVADLTHYNVSELPGHGWVFKILELNVRLLVMHDAVGSLDTSIHGFAGRVFGFWRNVTVWGGKFAELEDVPVEMVRLFEKQSAQAKKTIEDLGIQMPDSASMC